MRTIVLTLFFVVFVLPVWAETLTDNMVYFSVDAEEYVVRDEMKVDFLIHAEGSDRKRVANEVTERSNRVLRTGRSYSDLDLVLMSRSAYPYESGSSGRKIWKEDAVITARSQNFDSLNRFIASVQKDASVHNVQFLVSNTKRKSLQAALTQKVLDRFRGKADFITKALGASRYKMMNIRMHDDRGYEGRTGGGVYMMKAAEGSMSDAAIVPESGSGGFERISVRIDAAIQILP